MKRRTLSSPEKWLSLSRLLQYLCERLFTVPGAFVALVATLTLTYGLYPPQNVLEYITLPFAVFFWTLPLLLLPVVIPVVIGDVMAKILLAALFKKPDPQRWPHQALYILFSLPCLILSIVFVISSDSWNG